MTLSVLTANGLLDGEVLYLTATGDWSQRLSESDVARSPEDEARLLEIGEQAVAARLVVGPYLAKVAEANGQIQPLGQREIIRAAGPTVRTDLERQAPGREAAA